MTSKLSRLRKLSEEATPGPWIENGLLWMNDHTEADVSDEEGDNWITFKTENPEADRELWIECRNSLPAVLNLIEAAQPVSEWDELPDYEYTPEECAELLQQLGVLREAVAVFVSGQEEPR